MNLQLIAPRPADPLLRQWTVQCCSCGRWVGMYDDTQPPYDVAGPAYADLDGPAYQAYYCGPCHDRLVDAQQSPD